MKHSKLKLESSFEVILGNDRSQAAEMVIAPGKSEGGPDNRHSGADQWLLVLSGSGTAIVNQKEYQLEEHSLILIERGDTHEIRNSGSTPLKTVNFYVPPAYTQNGEELPPGRA